MIDAVIALAPTPGLTASACAALNVSRASVYRQRARLARPSAVRHPRPKPRRALAVVERQIVLDLLRAPRFADQAPAEIYACLLDEGVYHCSIRTMYRILAASQEIRERRNQLRHPVYKKPELLAQAPNEVWSWDITKLMGPAKWSYFYLYVIIDIFSRRVVGWCVADRESATLFAALFDDATTKHPAPKVSSPCTPIVVVRCEPRPRHYCSPISASPNPTAGRTHPMTILSRKAISKP